LARPGSKLAKVLLLMQRPQGATVAELAKATGWKKHTVRGAISGAVKKKLHQRVKVITENNRRAYLIAKHSAGKPARAGRTAKTAQTTTVEPGTP
jgi:predicted transcriptional regulator